MESKNFLDFIPRRYLCPYCGEWHKWKFSHELGCYDGFLIADLECEKQSMRYSNGPMEIHFSKGNCYGMVNSICLRGNLLFNGKLSIENIVEDDKKSRITFHVSHTAGRLVAMNECFYCKRKEDCLMCKLSDMYINRGQKDILIGFEFEKSDYNQFAKSAILARKEKEPHEHEQTIDNKKRVSKQPQLKEKKEDTTMVNINIEFGPNKDENIASTLMGIAVKNGDSWRIYDKKKKEITDVGNIQLGKLPIYILPTTKLSEGDLIKDAGEYYFVIKVATSKTPAQTLSVRTGEMKNVVPIKNVLGFSCYSKVIALGDSLNMSEDFDVEKLAIMSTMCGQTDESSAQLLPLMLFKDKLDGNDDMVKLLLMSSMMTSEKDGGQMNQLLPLMLFKDKLGGDDDMANLLLMSSMMGSNMAGSNNPMMSYLLLDKFMGKKEGKVSQNIDKEGKASQNIDEETAE